MATSLPRPQAIRLSSSAGGGRPPPTPFGLTTWTADAGAEAVAVVLELPEGYGLGDVVRQLTDPGGFDARTLVVVLGETAGGGVKLLSRIFGGRRARVDRGVRGSALLARGYVELGAAVDGATGQDLVWGYSRK